MLSRVQHFLQVKPLFGIHHLYVIPSHSRPAILRIDTNTGFLSHFPFLLVIITTPLAAREPYIAVEEASFNTVMLSMSFGFNAVNAPDDIGEPSRIKEVLYLN